MSVPDVGRPAGRRLAFAAAGALAAATTALWIVSRGKWSDAIIDSGREWIVPDALARGELLYRDVVYWFGPLTPYLHAAWLRVFGSSLSTLVVAGTLESAAMLVVLFAALRLVASRLEAALWTLLAIPVVVFMLGGVLVGMAYRHAATFALLALTLACRSQIRNRRSTLAFAGVLCGMAGLCRTEWGIAALSAAGLGILVSGRLRTRAWQDTLLLAGAALLTFGIVIAGFVAAAGFQPVIQEGHLLLTGVPAETRRFVLALSGIGNWRTGIANVLYSAGLWFGIFLLVRLLTVGRIDPARSKADSKSLAVVLLLLGILALLDGASGAILWSGAPVLYVLAVFLGVRRPGGRTSAVLVSFGSMGLVMSYRRILHSGDSWYVGAPLLFACVSGAALVRLALASDRRRAPRDLLRKGLELTLGIMIFLTFAMRLFQYGSDSRVAIAGTDGFLSARPELASSIERMASVIRRETRDGDGLVVFPEGEILNYLSGRPNPCRHKMSLPGYLTRANEKDFLEELNRVRPAAIVVWRRLTVEYGPASFGEDYGKSIRAWLDANYQPRTTSGGRHPEMVLYLPRNP